VIRLESLLKLPKPDRHVFSEHLTKATEIDVEGVQLGDKITGKKSIWKSTIEDGPEVGVEELSLEHYRKQGWNG